MPIDTSIKHARLRNSPPADSDFSADTVLLSTLPSEMDGRATPVIESNSHEQTPAGVAVEDPLPRVEPGRPLLTRSGEQARSDEGLLRTMWGHFFGRPPHRLLEEEER